MLPHNSTPYYLFLQAKEKKDTITSKVPLHMNKNFIVITSINALTEAVKAFAKIKGSQVIVVGDKKTPPIPREPHPNVTYLSVDDQSQLDLQYVTHCPLNNYGRKNIGYLYALSQGAETITDTDDDNFPYEEWGMMIDEGVSNIPAISSPKFVNIYKHFTNEHIWPRGLPLDEILSENAVTIEPVSEKKIAIWQGLVDKDPDVDAIYRLTVGKFISFDKKPPISLAEGVYCPFNTQNTVWTLKEAFPYLYIPTSATIRFCDILKGYIAQRGIWALSARLAFTGPTAYQERNPHNLMADFIHEIPCYRDIKKLVTILDETELTGNASADIVKIYERLHEADIVASSDVLGVTQFVADLAKLGL